jgi:hypothetical protein
MGAEAAPFFNAEKANDTQLWGREMVSGAKKVDKMRNSRRVAPLLVMKVRQSHQLRLYLLCHLEALILIIMLCDI